MLKKKIAILFGGVSSEHEVSRISASSIIANIDESKYELILIGITKSGEWFLYSGNLEDIKDGSWENHENNKRAFIVPDASIGGILVLNNGKYEKINIDVIIPVLHGKNGEDGTIQGLFQLAGIPFVGCDTTSASGCMDKVFTNTILSYNNIKKPKFYWFFSYDFKNNSDKCIEDTDAFFEGKYPLFVKPANAGSSVGVSKVNNKGELKKAFELAINEDSKIVIEQGIIGQEVECAILGNSDPIASFVGEIAASADFYDYEDKYINGTSKLYIPAHIPENVAGEIRKTAIKAFKIMGCKGLSRVDFFVEKGTNKVFLNEINTFPGFTSISMYPKLMEHFGINFKTLIDKLIDLSLEK